MPTVTAFRTADLMTVFRHFLVVFCRSAMRADAYHHATSLMPFMLFFSLMLPQLKLHLSFALPFVLGAMPLFKFLRFKLKLQSHLGLSTDFP